MGRTHSYLDEYDYDENFVDDFGNYEDEIGQQPYISPKKEKKLAKVAQKQSGELNKKKDKSRKSSYHSSPKEPTIISSVPVESTCNKCGHYVQGELLSYVYQEATDLNAPFIQYYCSECGHYGSRCDWSRALPSDQFDRKYFR